MSYRGINDYEIIYLIQTYPNHPIFDLLITKYQKLIYKNIHMMSVSEYEFDDFYQEGIIALYTTAIKFSEEYNKTFMRLFELVLKRRYIRIKEKKKLVLFEDYDFINTLVMEDNKELTLEVLENSIKNNLEKIVYEKHFILGHSIKTITNDLKCDSKQIYNAIYRIKDKYRKILKEEQ